MAIVSKFSHASATVDLNDVNTGFSMAGDGWMPVVATPVYGRDPEPVTETIHLLLRDTSQDNIAADMQALHFMQVQADAYINDPTVDDPVWLHAKMNNETGERRAVVYKIEVQYGASWYGDEATSLDIPLTLSVTRGPYWESTTARDLPADTGNTGVIHVYDYTASGASVAAHDIVGDVGARIDLFTMDPNAYTDFYIIGARSAAKHNASGISNFVPIWEFENGTLETDCTTAADTGASGGGKVVVSESVYEWDNSEHQVVKLRVADVTANTTDQAGMFLPIIRARVANASTWRINIRYTFGKSSGASYKQGIFMDVSATAWGSYISDPVVIPANDIKSIPVSTVDTISETSLNLRAKRISGAENLEIDCVSMIPIDECFVRLDITTEQGIVYFGQSPIGSLSLFSVSSATAMDKVGTFSNNNLNLPIGDGRLYVFRDYSTSAEITDNLSFNSSDIGKYYERWLSLRGTE